MVMNGMLEDDYAPPTRRPLLMTLLPVVVLVLIVALLVTWLRGRGD